VDVRDELQASDLYYPRSVRGVGVQVVDIADAPFGAHGIRNTSYRTPSGWNTDAFVDHLGATYIRAYRASQRNARWFLLALVQSGAA
jgi:hypothetical protein